jgi:hypothetical protein
VTWNYIDLFIFRPDAKAPFQYKRANGRTITPRLMETDGGSTPQILRGMRKFSSWGYAPAFIVHDWLFTAKKCDYAPDNVFAFEETAMIMAEIMKTLTEVGYTDYQGNVVKLPKLEDTIYLMYLGVVSSVARKVWDDNTLVHCFASTDV